MTPPVIDPVIDVADLRDFWMNVALVLKEQVISRGKRIDALEAQVRDQAAVNSSVQGLCYNALSTDGAQHKQWCLEEILQRVSKPEEYERVRVEWTPGVAP